MTTQLITPNPNIECTPGMCLQYVRQTFGLPIRYGSATEAWNNSTSQHQDTSFPAGCWVPIWFSIDIEPNGHVALLAPDGTVYSSSDNTNVPHHHPSIDDLVSYYAYWGKMQLTLLGWTEDVAGFPVVDTGSINVDSAPTTPTPAAPEGFLMELSPIEQRALYNNIDYIASAKFKEDIFAGTTDAEKAARMAFHNELLDAPIGNIKTGGETSIRTQVGWLPADFANAPANVLTQTVKLSDGSVNNVAAILDRLLTKAGTTVTGTAPAAFDAEAFVARLKAELPAAVVAEIKTQWNK